MTTKFRTLVEGMPAERQERIRQRAKALLDRIQLEEPDHRDVPGSIARRQNSKAAPGEAE